MTPLAAPPSDPTSPQASDHWHALAPERVSEELGTSLGGLDDAEAAGRLRRFGPNRLPRPKPVSPLWILLRQFRSPLIYVLLVAAAIALLLGERADAGFIFAVLLLNAAIGFFNESRAEREVRALGALVRTRARVRRGRRILDVDGEEVVPGDLLVLESGSRVSADARLVEAHGLRVDESLLTGESVPVDKEEDLRLPATTPLAERRNMVFAGCMVASGRGFGLVVATAAQTQVGAIAATMAAIRPEPPPLLRRMERFARVVGGATVVLAAVLVTIGTLRGQPFGEMLLGAVALAVSSIPEGLPVALTVALAVAVSRMARRRVVVRHLPAVEALGSCGVIATDKTGTLTRNELTVEGLTAGGLECRVTGVGYAPLGSVQRNSRPVVAAEHPPLFRLLRAACLANEASLSQRADAEEEWEWSGDPTDVALLCLSLKAGCDTVALRAVHRTLATLPFEPERRYASSIHSAEIGSVECVKGAPERVVAMCSRELSDGVEKPLDAERALREVEDWMRQGYRVLALADAERSAAPAEGAPAPEPSDLVFLGLVAMTDPPRPGVPEALAQCRRAGVRVVMVTGDHATTASAIAERIGLVETGASVLTGAEIASMDDAALTERIGECAVVARATPADKLRVVRGWQQRGELVAVTGDGVNDAPALRQADLGVAMGASGTDVAREASELVITDDDFSSIVAGVEEGRVAYDNVRKATYLLVSTGLGEVILVTAALSLGYPLPLTAVQLLWLNLVTNGIQDVSLGFEPAEPGVLDRAPRPARERIFNRIMIERTLLAGLVFGGIGLASWIHWIGEGRSVEESRNLLVQLFVIFEILHIGNSRSETISIFRINPFSNPVLFVGTLGALTVHGIAMHVPFLRDPLGIALPSPQDGLRLLVLALPVLVAMELHKAWRRRRSVSGS